MKYRVGVVVKNGDTFDEAWYCEVVVIADNDRDATLIACQVASTPPRQGGPAHIQITEFNIIDRIAG